jgi:very-short-patch-repair endonuclease
MVGTQQAVYIDSILRRRLTVSEYQRRRILCGNASQFQGDERDVIFISMVNSPTESGRPLHLRTRDDARKVFNVAASRARDQLWVVHSLDPQKDLKPNDLRLKMITHAENPAGLRPKTIEVAERKLNSELEKQVHEELVKAKYRTIIGCPVGEFTIDLVVVGKRGNRVAIQCDGDREITREALEAGLHKQMTLERLGWRFIRVRGSEYLRHPDETMRKIQKSLKKFEIQPLGLFESNGKNNGKGAKDEEDLQSSDLHKQVLQRAESIRTRWKDIPSVSSIFKKG